MSDSFAQPTAAGLPVLRLKRNEDRRLSAGHLWIFSNEVEIAATPLTKFAPGALVRVLAHNDRALGLAYVNPKSLISARLLSSPRLPTAAWFEARFRRALALRQRLYATSHYRLVYGESDGLPGLVVDRFADSCVVQIGTAGMERLKSEILAGLDAAVGPRHVLIKNDMPGRELEGLPSYVEDGKGHCEELLQVIEDGAPFQAPAREGQKTGWYFDQSANRRALKKYLQPGARVLDLFSYVGAWGIAAGRAGAGRVLCVDGSAAALKLAGANATLNGITLGTEQGDVFDVLEALHRRGERFDVVICDPPAFAKRKKDLPKALGAYRRLNQLALQLIDGDGLLVSCSCSHHLAADELQAVIAKAARTLQVQVQVLEQGGQGPDHPVHPAIPETRYLKAFFCRVSPAWN